MSQSLLAWLLLLPLDFIVLLTGQPNVVGVAVLMACLAVVGLWIGILLRFKREKSPSKPVGLFLVAVANFPLLVFLVMVKAFGVSQQFPLVNQLMALIQVYFCLSVIAHCEAYWQHRGRAGYITASLATLTSLPIWIIASFCYALTLQ